MRRRVPTAAVDVRNVLAAQFRDRAARFDVTFDGDFERMRPARSPFGRIAERLEAGDAVVIYGWQLPSDLPGHRPRFVRVETDGSLTAFDQHPEVHPAAVGRRLDVGGDRAR